MAINALRISADAGLKFFAQDSGGAVIRRLFGAGVFPAMDISMSYGTGNNQCNWVYWGPSRVLTATTYDTLDIYGSAVDPFNTTVNATKLKLAALAIHSPDGTKKLRFGPQNQSNAAQLNFGGTGATAYAELSDWLIPVFDPYTGFTITSGTGDKVIVYNPGGSSVTYSILMAGV